MRAKTEWKHNARKAVSAVLLLLPLAGVVAAGLGALDVRARLMNMYPPLYGGLLAGAVTAVALYVVVRLICFQVCLLSVLFCRDPETSDLRPQTLESRSQTLGLRPCMRDLT